MSLPIVFLLVSGAVSLVASLAHLHIITKKKRNSLWAAPFITGQVSFWLILVYVFLSNSTARSAFLSAFQTQEFRVTIGLVAGVLSIIEFIPYFYSIIKGRTKPERATWLIWSIITILGFFAYYSSGGRDAIWVPLGYVANTVTTFLLSIKYGVGGWNRFDKIVLGSIVLCLLTWFVSGSPVIALAMIITIDLLAALPTVKKTYIHPEEEDRLAWVISLSTTGLNLFAIEQWDFAHAAYPLYLFIMAGIILELMLRPHRRRQRLSR